MIRSLSENKDSENDESVDSQIINPNRENMESWREETKERKMEGQISAWAEGPHVSWRDLDSITTARSSNGRRPWTDG